MFSVFNYADTGQSARSKMKLLLESLYMRRRHKKALRGSEYCVCVYVDVCRDVWTHIDEKRRERWRRKC